MEQFQLCLFAIQVFQLFFFIFQSALYKRKEYLYYTLYVLASILYLIGLTVVERHSTDENVAFYTFLDKPFAFLSYFLYFKFAKYFLDIPTIYPAFAKKIKSIEYVLLSFAIILILLTPICSAETNEMVFSIFSFISIPLAFYSIIKFVKIKTNRLNYFVVIGASLMVTAAISTFLFIKFQQLYPNILNYPAYLHYHIFIILELLVFSIGLGYKAYKTEFEKALLDRRLIAELLEKEKIQQNLNQTRNQMARDLHDDIGASLSGIKILADLTHTETGNENADEISTIATQLLSDFRETTWFLAEETDTIQTLVAQLEKQWKALLKAQHKTLKIQLPASISTLKISILQKKNLYLFCKEAINNSMKHADASEINLIFNRHENALILMITDNGVYKPRIEQTGYGLENMKKRLADIQGQLEIYCAPTESVILTAKFPIL